MKDKNIIDKDCCKECIGKKHKETIQAKYGVDSVAHLDEVKAKKIKTCIERYGVENPMLSKDIQDKGRQTNLERYGVRFIGQSEIVKNKNKKIFQDKFGGTSPMASLEVRNKFKNTIFERYGVENVSCLEEVKRKKEETSLKNYGVRYPLQSDEYRHKLMKSYFKKGKVATSTEQIEVFNLLKTMGYEPILNYLENGYFLDVAIFIDDKKIDIEYDGWYWHDTEQRRLKDKIRNEKLIKNGWKVIRILGGLLLPTRNDLYLSINKAILGDENLQYILLEDWEKKLNYISVLKTRRNKTCTE